MPSASGGYEIIFVLYLQIDLCKRHFPWDATCGSEELIFSLSIFFFIHFISKCICIVKIVLLHITHVSRHAKSIDVILTGCGGCSG